MLDPDLLRGERMGAPIVQFFFESLGALRAKLRELGSDLALLEGDFARELSGLAKRLGADAVFYNDDTDPQMRLRDERVSKSLQNAGLNVTAFRDLVYNGGHDVLQDSGKFYTVFTPYRRKWDAVAAARPQAPIPSLQAVRKRLTPAAKIGKTREIPKPEDYGRTSSADFPRGGSAAAAKHLLDFVDAHMAEYADVRNSPSLDATSRLSPHLRAGTIGIRTCVAAAMHVRERSRSTTGANTWLGELVWRDFYHQLLVNAPRVAAEPFVEAAKAIAYRDDERAWNAWTNGTTGYPIVDAAMVQLNTTGWMHNRLRMIVASFLTKHLLIDYHAGERYFEQHLADADLAANNGGWQWSASTGCDAAPYFRVFNPTLQGKTYDPDGAFVRSMLPALAKLPARYIHEPWAMPPLIAAEAGFAIGRDYPEPIVEHTAARARALEAYGSVLARKPMR